jgi:hypothetical protein
MVLCKLLASKFIHVLNSNVQIQLQELPLQTAIAYTYSECYQHRPLFSGGLSESHALLDFCNSQRGVQSLGAGS